MISTAVLPGIPCTWEPIWEQCRGTVLIWPADSWLRPEQQASCWPERATSLTSRSSPPGRFVVTAQEHDFEELQPFVTAANGFPVPEDNVFANLTAPNDGALATSVVSPDRR